MNLGLVSLIVLLLAIVIGFYQKCKCWNFMCWIFYDLKIIVYKVDIKIVIPGLSSSLFIQMVGITYLFAIIQEMEHWNYLQEKW